MADFDLSASFIPSLHKPASLLPIARHRQNLLYLIETYPVTIVVGQTGSGKTTQIPQFLEQAGWCSDGKVIAVTQVAFQFSRNSKITDVLSASSSSSDYGCTQSRRRGRMQSGRRSWIFHPLRRCHLCGDE